MHDLLSMLYSSTWLEGLDIVCCGIIVKVGEHMVFRKGLHRRHEVFPPALAVLNYLQSHQCS